MIKNLDIFGVILFLLHDLRDISEIILLMENEPLRSNVRSKYKMESENERLTKETVFFIFHLTLFFLRDN